jgi:hypothetical protein
MIFAERGGRTETASAQFNVAVSLEHDKGEIFRYQRL